MFRKKVKKEVDEEYEELKTKLKDETNCVNQFLKNVTELSKISKVFTTTLKKVNTQICTGLNNIAEKKEESVEEVDKTGEAVTVIEQDFNAYDTIINDKCIAPTKGRVDQMKTLKKIVYASDACEAKYYKQVTTVASLEKKKKTQEEKLVQARALKEHLEGKYKEDREICKQELRAALVGTEDFYEKVRFELCDIMKTTFGIFGEHFTSYCEGIQAKCAVVGKLEYST